MINKCEVETIKNVMNWFSNLLCDCNRGTKA